MEQNNRKKILWTVLALLVVAAITGFSTYYIMNQQAQKDKEALDAQITELNNKVAELEAAQAATEEELDEEDDSATANWETYTNTAYGFTLKYPTGYTATETVSDGAGGGLININLKGSTESFLVTVAEKGFTLSPNGMDPASITDFTIAGYPGKNFDSTAYGVQIGDYIYRFVADTDASTGTKANLKLIAESFTLTK